MSRGHKEGHLCLNLSPRIAQKRPSAPRDGGVSRSSRGIKAIAELGILQERQGATERWVSSEYQEADHAPHDAQLSFHCRGIQTCQPSHGKVERTDRFSHHRVLKAIRSSRCHRQSQPSFFVPTYRRNKSLIRRPTTRVREDQILQETTGILTTNASAWHDAQSGA
ncbi:hypothetical protein VTJ83DRAFT_2530 [Remersonia thermophila]|uniref:Uncharacterized protein n=1 Tax=Remersonia thermophila TaxID=72144 RepID=A0ABR4DIZ4_9PEZI